MSPRADAAAVVDASAIAALVFGEPEAESVARRIEGLALVAPSLLAYEVANVGLKKIRQTPDRRVQIRACHQLVSRMEIRAVDVPPEEVLDLAEQLGMTVYDTAYLWLARSLGCGLITLDRGLAAAARR